MAGVIFSANLLALGTNEGSSGCSASIWSSKPSIASLHKISYVLQAVPHECQKQVQQYIFAMTSSPLQIGHAASTLGELRAVSDLQSVIVLPIRTGPAARTRGFKCGLYEARVQPPHRAFTRAPDPDTELCIVLCTVMIGFRHSTDLRSLQIRLLVQTVIQSSNHRGGIDSRTRRVGKGPSSYQRCMWIAVLHRG